MKKNKWLFYFIYSVVISGYIVFAIKIMAYLVELKFKSLNYMHLAIIVPILFIVLGVLLGVGHLISEKRNEGRWKINLPKIIFFGIPSLYFSVGAYIYMYWPNKFSEIVFAPFHFIFTDQVTAELFFEFATVLQVIFGYIIITSLIKVKDKIENLSEKVQLADDDFE